MTATWTKRQYFRHHMNKDATPRRTLEIFVLNAIESI